MKITSGTYEVLSRGPMFTLKGAQKEKKEMTENLFKEVMAKTFPNMGKEMDIQIQEAHRIAPVEEKCKDKSTQGHIIFKLSNVKDES